MAALGRIALRAWGAPALAAGRTGAVRVAALSGRAPGSSLGAAGLRSFSGVSGFGDGDDAGSRRTEDDIAEEMLREGDAAVNDGESIPIPTEEEVMREFEDLAADGGVDVREVYGAFEDDGLPRTLRQLKESEVRMPGESKEEYAVRRKAELEAEGWVAVDDLPSFSSHMKEQVRRDVVDDDSLLDSARAAAEAEYERLGVDVDLEKVDWDSDGSIALEDMRIQGAPAWMLFEEERDSYMRSGEGEAQSRQKWYSQAKIKVPMRDEQGRAYATGRRKTATARVWLKLGDGNFTVNNMPLVEYFDRPSARKECLAAFIATRSCGAFDVKCTVSGGGKSGQAGAIKHGVSRALANYDPFLRPVLKKLKLVVRDPRMVERKKPGQRKARKKVQWVKR